MNNIHIIGPNRLNLQAAINKIVSMSVDVGRIDRTT